MVNRALSTSLFQGPSFVEWSTSVYAPSSKKLWVTTRGSASQLLLSLVKLGCKGWVGPFDLDFAPGFLLFEVSTGPFKEIRDLVFASTLRVAPRLDPCEVFP